MTREKHLETLRNKIYELNTGLFVSQSDAVLKMPSSVISILKVDDVGQLWFFVPRPKQYVNEFEKSFFSRIDFFRKDKNFFLQTYGRAYLVTDPEEINSLVDVDDEVRQKAIGEAVLVKVKLLDVQYFQSRKNQPASIVTKMKDSLQKIIFNQSPAYRPYQLYRDVLNYQLD